MFWYVRPSSSTNEELPSTSTVPDIPPRPSSVSRTNSNTNITPDIPKDPKLNNINENKDNLNRENIPPNPVPKTPILNRETLSIYRPFNHAQSINGADGQYKKKFDAVTGRYVRVTYHFLKFLLYFYLFSS